MKNDYKGFIREYIKRNPVTIHPDVPLYEARELMRVKGIRHLPVVNKENKLVGIITDRDIRQVVLSGETLLMEKMKVSTILELNDLLKNQAVFAFMTPLEKLITITPETLVEEAAQLMRDHKIGCLPVVEKDKLYGILTQTDVLDQFVDIFGANQNGTRLTVALEDIPGTMFEILKVIKMHKVNIISIVTPSFMMAGKRLAFIRIKSQDYGEIVNDLENGGYQVLSIDDLKLHN